MITFIFSGKSAAQAWLCSYSLPLLGMVSDGVSRRPGQFRSQLESAEGLLTLKPGTCTVKSIEVLVAQFCPTLCDPMDCSLSGSSVHGNLQARILEWVAMPSSRRSSHHREDLLNPGFKPRCPEL